MNAIRPIAMPDDARRAMEAERAAAGMAAVEENRRIRREMAAYAKAHRSSIDADWNVIELPPRTAADHLATLSPERRAQLDGEWA